MKKEIKKTDAFTPFNTIGLCFSGGGYRATFFALGILSYLDQAHYNNKSLLQAVKALSTVSGGTLTGIAFAKALQDPDYNFNRFFTEFYNTFTPNNDTLLKNALSKFKNDTIWINNPSKKRSLINAFALTYNEMPLFEGDFNSFNKETIKHLEQVCFNATDFSFGVTYRFQNQGYFGNNPLYKSNQKEINAVRHQVKLSDVIASSSCFPVGFEPLVFPDDYFDNHEAKEYKDIKNLEVFSKGVGIMDGAIADNEGIGSMMHINNRIKGGLDLIIVADAGSFKMQPWEQDDTVEVKEDSIKTVLNKVLNYFKLNPLYWLLLIVSMSIVFLNSRAVFSAVPLTWVYIVSSIFIGVSLVLTTFGIVASTKITAMKKSVNKLFKRVVPEPLLDDLLSFQNLDLGLVKRMIKERSTSSMTMMNDVFLNQMRRLSYDLFYSKKALKHKRITATLYKLNGEATPYVKSSFNKGITPVPSNVLKKVSHIASQTPTVLWWDAKDIENNRLQNLIACGQFTICYELMDYILKLKADESSPIKDFTEIDALYYQLQKDWEAFNEDPMWLLNSSLRVKY